MRAALVAALGASKRDRALDSRESFRLARGIDAKRIDVAHDAFRDLDCVADLLSSEVLQAECARELRFLALESGWDALLRRAEAQADYELVELLAPALLLGSVAAGVRERERLLSLDAFARLVGGGS